MERSEFLPHPASADPVHLAVDARADVRIQPGISEESLQGLYEVSFDAEAAAVPLPGI